MKLSKLKIDAKASEHGIWFDYVGDIKLKIARAGCKAYKDKIAVEYIKLAETGVTSPTDEQNETLARSALCECLMGWKNLEDDDGKDIKYSHDFSKELLTNPELEDLYDFVFTKANTREHYRLKLKAKTKKK